MLSGLLRVILCLSFLISLTGCKSLFYPKSYKNSYKNIEGFEPKDTIPQDNEISGWIKDGEMVYCEDMVCLASLINGAAPYYIDGGALKIIFQDFEKSSGNMRLSLEIYQTKSHSQAQALYNGASSISPVTIEALGESGRLDQGLIGFYRVETYKKNFFIRLVTMDKSESSREEILTFAKKVSSKIP